MSVQLVILGLLSEQPRHGYELRQEVERRLYATYINLSGGSLYYNLGQLERSGYVKKARVEQMGRYPTRQVYQITAEGKEYLKTELRRLLLDTDAREKVFDPLNAALAFWQSDDVDDLREVLRIQLDWARKRAEWIIRQQSYWSEKNIALPQTKIIEHGLVHLEAEVRWLEKFLQDLEDSKSQERPPEPVSQVS